jgi:hypothetical protein
MVEAEEMYVRALRGYEKAARTDHWRTQTIALNLRSLHKQHEQNYDLAGYGKANVFRKNILKTVKTVLRRRQ